MLDVRTAIKGKFKDVQLLLLLSMPNGKENQSEAIIIKANLYKLVIVSMEGNSFCFASFSHAIRVTENGNCQ